MGTPPLNLPSASALVRRQRRLALLPLPDMALFLRPIRL
jgi:hypothetical protein